ncbi:hypothetical protein GCM10007160_11550 [Litchfieldella qijiaojingensis]|uniref:Periplasmic heavy metal sensor n=1 Tax=Litchfieldella qijiaojingensis TaxID=980347 RepID=A0ABQ2YLZ2_9GAMM|nr:hypothetical protein [Halomonas qijiaojingensis]GGX86023.1 hypothetical protein GCM10007160_11550 [Halomonas qijiaojingensis]
MIRLITRKLLMPALLAAAIAPLTLAAIASPGEGPHHPWSERHQEHRQALYERAGLDAETRAALDEAHREHREAMHELQHQHREQMAEILDDEQHEALRAAMREMHEEHHAERRQAMQERLNVLIDGWGLSEDERQALLDAREAMMSDARELRNQEFDSREDRRAAWLELRDEHRAALSEILSDEQMAELRDIMKPHHGHHKGHHGMPHGKHGSSHQDEDA